MAFCKGQTNEQGWQATADILHKSRHAMKNAVLQKSRSATRNAVWQKSRYATRNAVLQMSRCAMTNAAFAKLLLQKSKSRDVGGCGVRWGGDVKQRWLLLLACLVGVAREEV